MFSIYEYELFYSSIQSALAPTTSGVSAKLGIAMDIARSADRQKQYPHLDAADKNGNDISQSC